MKRRDHKSAAEAIREAMRHEYTPAHRRDGLIVLTDGKRRLAVAREARPRSTVWHLVDEFPADRPIEATP